MARPTPKLVQFQIVQESNDGFSVFALDDQGHLWMNRFPFKPNWVQLSSPANQPTSTISMKERSVPAPAPAMTTDADPD